MLLEITSRNTKDLGIEFEASKEQTILDVASGVGLVFDSLKEVPEAFDLSLNALLAENKAVFFHRKPKVLMSEANTLLYTLNIATN
ncbi:hypothetical protein FJZ31_31205 [Candidatus Poribacteria bacterium]|nr:hypothetical protein [Candidatus Poribacteria bacterium]